jgi:N-acetylneuraminic acid mutarotase
MPKKVPVGQTWLLILLILLLFSVSVFAYARFRPHPSSILTHNAHQQATVNPNATVTQQQGPNDWQQLSSLPSAEADNTAIYVQAQGQNYIYTSGGFRGSKHFPYYDRNLYRYNVSAAHWEPVTAIQFPGMLNNAVAVDEQGRLFFTTGYSTDTYMVTSLLYMYQPGTNNLQKILLPPQLPTGFGTAMIADRQGHLYITQGYMKGGNAQEAAGTGWYRYDIATGQWHALTPLPQSLGYVMLALTDNGNILLQGGATDAGQHQQSNKIYIYNVAQNTWTQEQATMPQRLSGAASCTVRPGQMVVIGGYDAMHDTGLNTAWLVDLHTLRWSPLASLPVGDSVLGSAACDGMGHVYLVRGASDPSHPTADFWQLTLNKPA